ncbi:MAG: histidine kinase [Algibacter sp.]
MASAQTSVLDSLQHRYKSKLDSDSLKLESCLDLAKYYMNVDVRKASPYLNEALEYSKNLKNKQLTAKIFNSFSLLHRASGNELKALEFAIDAKKIIDIYGTKQEKIIANSELLNSYINTGDFEKAIALAELNKKLVLSEPSSSNKARLFFDAGNVYKIVNNYSEAKKNYSQAINICKEINFVPGEMVMKVKLGLLFIAEKQYDRAILTFKETLKYYEKVKQPTRQGTSFLHLGKSYSLKGDSKKAIPELLNALFFFEKTGANLFQKNEIQELLFYNYAILGESSKALKFKTQYKQLRDSIVSKNKTKLIEGLKVKYDTDKLLAEKEISKQNTLLLKQKVKLNKYFFLAITGLLIVLLVIGLFLFLRYKNKQKTFFLASELKETQKRLVVEKQYRNSELKALNAQMNPHFIFNTLNSIQEYIVLNEKDLASSYLIKFSRLIRIYLEHSKENEVVLSEEIKALNIYLELEKNRFEDLLNYEISIAENIDLNSIKIPSLFIQPYVENALKHGLLHKKTDRKLSIIFTLNDNVLHCSIKDNGIGIEASKKLNAKRNPFHKSFATSTNEKRVRLLNSNRTNTIKVETKSLVNGINDGTEVIIKIPQ